MARVTWEERRPGPHAGRPFRQPRSASERIKCLSPGVVDCSIRLCASQHADLIKVFFFCDCTSPALCVVAALQSPRGNGARELQ